MIYREFCDNELVQEIEIHKVVIMDDSYVTWSNGFGNGESLRLYYTDSEGVMQPLTLFYQYERSLLGHNDVAESESFSMISIPEFRHGNSITIEEYIRNRSAYFKLFQYIYKLETE